MERNMNHQTGKTRRIASALFALGLLLGATLHGRGLEEGNQAPAAAGSIKGRVLDYETRIPLAGVSVSVLQEGITATSDERGDYAFPKIAVGYYALSFQLPNHYPETRTDVIVRPQRITYLNVSLLSLRSIHEEVTVQGNYFDSTAEKAASQMVINSEEMRRDAASAGDVSRVLYSVPGVVKADEEANDLIVRGGSPAENGFYIDNIFVPNINHFPQMGASGGNISMLNMDFIESLQMFTGGFDASHGNRLSSIVEIAYREGNRERINGQLNLSMIGYGGQVEGPFSGHKGSWMISANRSYLDLISKMMDSSNPSDFFDVQGKATYDVDKKNRLSLLAIVGGSGTEYEPSGREKFSTATVGLTWRHLWSGRGYSDTSISYSFINGNENDFKVLLNRRVEYFDYRSGWLTLRNLNHLQASPRHQFHFGFELQGFRHREREYYFEDEKRLRGTFGAAFATYVAQPFANLSLSAGLRCDSFPFSERVHFSPRLSASWTLNRRLSFNGSFGLFYQQMPTFLLTQDAGNGALRDSRARHLILGCRYLMSRDTQLILEGYDKRYADLPMSPIYRYDCVIDSVNGDNDQSYGMGPLVDEGRAYARGIELTLQKKLARSLYGLVNLTYYRARYRDLMGVWRNRLFDNRFIVCLSGGYKPSKYWEFSGRWIWSGNKAFTPVNEEKSIQAGYPWVNYEDIMAGHLADYQNLSLRLDRRFYFRGSNLVVFAGAWNILNHKNELSRQWIPQQNAYDSLYMWGTIPYIGFEFEF
jgi:hypothetical protein